MFPRSSVSMEEMNEDSENCCPLCMEEMDSTDRQLKPCRCGYQICVWCWNHIMEMAEKDSTEGRCPACRTPYDKEKIVSTAVSPDKYRLGEANDKKQKPGKSKTRATEGRKNLSNVRVIQRNLVYVVGMPSALADEETLERKEYFGQYGKILKISVSKTGSQHSSAGSSVSVYVTYVKEEDAMRCIQSVNGYMLDGKVLKACFGTTKYCNAWLKHMPCNNPDCLYLHDEGTREDSFTKEEMLAKYGSKSQHFHDLTHPAQRRFGIGLPPPADAPSLSSCVASQSQPQNALNLVGTAPKAIPLAVNPPKSSSLPAAASWGSRSSSRPNSGRTVTAPSGKSKTGAGLINLATVTGNCTSRQSVNNSGVKQLKATNMDGAQSSLPGTSKLPERPHSANGASAMLQGQGFPCNADDVDISRPVLDELISHRRKLSGSESKDVTTGATEEIKSMESSSLNKILGTEHQDMPSDIFAANNIVLAVTSQEHSKSSGGILTTVSAESALLDEAEKKAEKDSGTILRENIHSCSLDSRIDVGSCAEPDKSFQTTESGLQLAIFNALESPSVPDKRSGSGSSNLACSSPPSTVSKLSSPFRSDTALNCNIVSEDPWSSSVHPVNRDEPSVYSRGDTASQPDDSIPLETLKISENESLRKAPRNGTSEHELISDMFSTGFDLWTDGSAQDLAQLFFNKRKPGSAISSVHVETNSSWKSSSENKQSRFHFAREDELNEQALYSAKVSLQNEGDKHMWSEKYNRTQCGSNPIALNEVNVDHQVLSKCSQADYYGGSSSSHLTKGTMMAPPGFSSVRAPAAPPGFSQHKTTDIRRLQDSMDESPLPLARGTSYNHLEAANGTTDVEFIDPAIMAVGKGKRPTVPQTAATFTSSPSLSAFLSQTSPLSQQIRTCQDFETSFQPQQARSYRGFSSLNQNAHLAYSGQELDTSSSSLFHAPFSDSINQQRLMGQYSDTLLPHLMMQENVYGNGGHGTGKLRFQHSSPDDWNRYSELHSTGQPSVNDAVGRLGMSQITLDRVLQNRLDELTLTKDLSSKYYNDAAIPAAYTEQGHLSTSRLGRFFLQNGN
ncbi:hypothetical protein KP509_30G019900 [Ceratopteris richardii]|uniref:CCR4-NOT transcription complex subunit 4 n=1 Tax=Ceratopteris richardii TaxID=49495 RepID=A0A8T2R189_CERRI|nr:hypothetical protein KP509_30G019900 [Ceratopteris richardii]